MKNRIALLVFGSLLSVGSLHALGCGAEPAGESIERETGALGPSVPAYGAMFGDGWLGSSNLYLAGSNGLGYARANFIYVAGHEYSDPITDFDWVVENAAAAGVTVLPVLMKAQDGKAARLDLHSQDERGGWERFTTLLAKRYGPAGSFWGEHEGLVPYRPIQAWEIWNEPNLEEFGDLSPKAFRITLRIARRGLRTVDPEARIVLGGLSFSGGDAMDYLERVAATKSSRCLFDAVAIHPYAGTPEGALERVEKTVDKLRDLGLHGKGGGKDVGIWITEIGWAIASADWPLCEKMVEGECKQKAPFTVKDAETQADYLERFARGIEERRAAWHLGPTIWYAFSDLPLPDGEEQTWWRHCGLLEMDAAGQPAAARPSFWRAADIAAARPSVALPPVRCP